MKHLDLFSGIGGFALAADRVWSGVEHTFVEYDPFCQAVLKKHYPNSIIHGDIKQFIADTECKRWSGEPRETEGQHRLCRGSGQDEKPFILTGGFPCQPFSHAGRRKGTDDDRYLWPQMLRVIQLYRPTWVIAENVRGLVTWNDGMVLETVCADLESEGYEVQPIIIPAVAVGAPHRRDRVWIVAHANTPERTAHTEADKREHQYTWADDWREVAVTTCHDRVDDGLPRWMDGVTISGARHRKEQLKAYGNAIVPAIAEQIMRSL